MIGPLILMMIGMNLMYKKLLLSVVSLSVFASFTPAEAHWSAIERPGQARKDFVISRDEVVNSLQNQKLYALVEYGVISKIFVWNEAKPNEFVTSYIPGYSLPIDMIEEVVFVAQMPDSLSVNYVDNSGEVKAEPINHGDNVAVVEELPIDSATKVSLPTQNPVQVISSAVASDYSTSMTVAPMVVNDLNKSVEVQVITNGISFTSIATDNSATPITINNLPSDAFVSVQTVIRDKTTNEEIILQNVVTKTPDAQIPVVANARDVAADKATIAAPVVAASSVGSNGSRSATIEFAGIPDFDPTRTIASIMVVGPGGATTSVGVNGTGGAITIGDLGLDSTYRLTLVIRDLNSGEETLIQGANL